MELRRHISRALHEEHLTTIAVVERLETLLGRHSRERPPDAAAPEVARLLKDLVRVIETEIGSHFRFEEAFIFPPLAAAGDSEMSSFLVDEHRTILPLAERVVELARLACDSGFESEVWNEFHMKGAELAERLVSHIQKEEMGLLPALDDFLDEEQDSELAVALAARR